MNKEKRITTFNFNKVRLFTYTYKTSVFICLFYFSILSNSCKSIVKSQKSSIMTNEYNTQIKLDINESIQFEDGLTLTLMYFTHKRSFVDGPTKASAILKVSKNEITVEQALSIHGGNGKPEVFYDTIYWEEYEFQLKGFDYDGFIEVVVIKKE